MQKLRRAMVRPERELLSGTIEPDETFIGGRSTGRMGASTGKVPVMVAVERIGSHKLGRVCFGIDYAPGSLELIAFAQRTIAPGSMIHTDGARLFRRLSTLGYRMDELIASTVDRRHTALADRFVHAVADGAGSRVRRSCCPPGPPEGRSPVCRHRCFIPRYEMDRRTCELPRRVARSAKMCSALA